LISVIMVTLGLGAVMRGVAPLLFGGNSRRISAAHFAEPLVMHGIPDRARPGGGPWWWR
jgi:hypothetical protein